MPSGLPQTSDIARRGWHVANVDYVGKLVGITWWALIGGACNAAFLMASLLITKRLGSATFTTLVVVAAVVTCLVLDQFGLLGFEPRPINWLRDIGGALAITGVVFNRFS
jgi:transporter family-2 protein